MRNKNVIHNLNTVYPDLTKSERKIADFILSNSIDSQYMSITSLAEECSVADATISRFCKKLGYSSYNEFKLALAKNMGLKLQEVDPIAFEKISPQDSIPEMAQKLYAVDISAIHQSMELLNTEDIKCAVRLLHRADRVYCFGQGGSGVIAKEAWARFITVSGRFQCIEDSHMQVMATSMCSHRDVILFFSYSGATKDAIDTLSQAHRNDARVILVTHFPKCPAAAYADLMLLCGSQENPLHSGSIAAKMAQMFLIDILFNEYCRVDMMHTQENRETTSDALANKLV